MNETQRLNILKALDQCLDQDDVCTDNALFDAVDDARLALTEWDLQGPIPYEDALREWGLLTETLLAAPLPDEAVPMSDEETPPRPDAAQLDAILAALRQRIRNSVPGSADHIAVRAVREKLQTWDTRNLLPHATELAAWGIWPPATPDPDDELRPEFEAARSLLAARPYNAIQQLSALQSRARGVLVERIETELNQARVDLEDRTAALVSQARRVAQKKPKDLDAQARAWREVTAFNPQSRKGQEALTQLQQAVRQDIEEQLEYIEQRAHKAAQDNRLQADPEKRLPDLNTCRGDIEALCGRTDLPEELARSAQTLQTTVLKLQAETRERLGVASTLAGQREWRPAYKEARACLDRIPPILTIVDTAGLVGEAGQEVSTMDFFEYVTPKFLAHTRSRVDEYLQRARDNKQGAPQTALADLETARGWLTDEVWRPDHRQSLASQLEEVEREIGDAKRRLAKFGEAQEKVLKARQPGVPAQEQLKLLVAAQVIYPDYPSIKEHIEEARDNRAGELAGEVAAQLATARAQTLQEQFDVARETLEQARAAALQEVALPKPDSPLARELERVAQEEVAVARAEKALQDFKTLIARVDAALQEYDTTKELLRIQEARALLEQIPENFILHPLANDARARVAARQGDAENYDAGARAYEQRNWAGARDYLDKVSPAYAKAEEAKQLSQRARAALLAEVAQTLSAALTAQEDHQRLVSSNWQDREALDAAELRATTTVNAARGALKNLSESQTARIEVTWATAYFCYKEAVYIFDTIGDDERTADLAAACRKEKERLDQVHQADENVELLMETARVELTPVQEHNRQQLPLFSRLVSLPEKFRDCVSQLEAAAQQPSLIKNKIAGLLAEMRTAWRAAYLPALLEVVEKKGQGVEPSQIANVRQLIEELRTANLLYDDEQFKDMENLYYQVRKIQLDKAYTLLEEAAVKDWAALEANRRELLNLPGLDGQQRKDARNGLHAAQYNRLKEELDTLHADKGTDKALKFLGDQLRSGQVQVTYEWLQEWIELCWAAQEWEEADKVAVRFGNLATDFQTRITQLTLWQGLTRIARAYAGDDIDTAESYRTEIEKQVSDPVIDEEIERLEQETLDRLLDTTRAEHNRLDQLANVNPEDYLPVARGYAKVKKLSPENDTAVKGLQTVSGRLEPILAQRCQEAQSLKIGREGLPKARATAASLLADFYAIKAILPHLTLEEDTRILFDEARAASIAKKERWDYATLQLQFAQEEIEAAVAAPDAPRKESSSLNVGTIVQAPTFVGGGWDFSEARDLLARLKTQAGRDKDKELQALIGVELATLEEYETKANHLLQLACDLLTVIHTENFERVGVKAQTLEMAWKQAATQSVGWDGLEDNLLKHTYFHPQPHSISKLRDHCNWARQQQENLTQWETHEKKVGRLYVELTGAEKYEGFLTDELSDLKMNLSLRDIMARCEIWEKKDCTTFLKELEKTTAITPPLSARAAAARQQVTYDTRKVYLNGVRERVAKLGAKAQQLIKDLQEPLGRLRNHYNGLPKRVKNKRQSPNEGDKQLAQRWYRECQSIDPLNTEAQGLRKQLEAIGYTF